MNGCFSENIISFSETINIVPCTPNDSSLWEAIRSIRNQKDNRHWFGDGFLCCKLHKGYLEEKNSFYWVGLGLREDNKWDYIGFVGIVDDDVRVCVSEEYKNRGVGKRLLSFLFEKLGDKKKNLNIKVKQDNMNSRNLFYKFGFVDYCTISEKGKEYRILRFKDKEKV